VGGGLITSSTINSTNLTKIGSDIVLEIVNFRLKPYSGLGLHLLI